MMVLELLIHTLPMSLIEGGRLNYPHEARSRVPD